MGFLNPNPTVFPTVQTSRIPLPLDQYSHPQSQFASENGGEITRNFQKDSVPMIKKLFKNKQQPLETPVKKIAKPRVRSTKLKNVKKEHFEEINFEDASFRVLDKSRGKLDVAVMSCCAGKLIWRFEENKMTLKMCDRCVDLNRGYARISD